MILNCFYDWMLLFILYFTTENTLVESGE